MKSKKTVSKENSHSQDYWIEEMFSKPGAKGGLHRSTGTPAGKKISKKKLAKAGKSKSKKVRKQAQAAKTLAKLRPHG